MSTCGHRGPPAPLPPPHGPLLLPLSAPGPGRPRRARLEASGQRLSSESRFAPDGSCGFCKAQGFWTFKYRRIGGKYLKHKSDRLTGEDARGEASKLSIRLQENTSWGWDGLAPDSRPTFERLVSKSQSWGERPGLKDKITNARVVKTRPRRRLYGT